MKFATGWRSQRRRQDHKVSGHEKTLVALTKPLRLRVPPLGTSFIPILLVFPQIALQIVDFGPEVVQRILDRLPITIGKHLPN
jgi:hypothetical protein